MEPEVEQQRQPKKEANVERKECTDDDDEEEEEEENADAKVNAPTFYTDAKQYWKVLKYKSILLHTTSSSSPSSSSSFFNCRVSQLLWMV